MEIGKLTLELVKPQDLDEQLVTLTGCPAIVIHANLKHAAIADHVAAALLPFVKDPPPRHELAQAIADAGVMDLREAVREIYAAELGIEPEPMPEHLKALEAEDAPAKKGRRRGK